MQVIHREVLVITFIRRSQFPSFSQINGVTFTPVSYLNSDIFPGKGEDTFVGFQTFRLEVTQLPKTRLRFAGIGAGACFVRLTVPLFRRELTPDIVRDPLLISLSSPPWGYLS